MSSPLKVGIIGTGRVGAVIGAALLKAGYDVVAVAGESDASRRRAAALLPGVPVEKPSGVARRCDLLFLTVPDDMLANVATMLVGAGAVHAGQVVVHTSGAHGIGTLAPVLDAGARRIAMHPAMTLTGVAADVAKLQGAPFGLTSDGDVHDLAERLVTDIGGKPMWIPEEMRTLYHAGLAHGANHLVTVVAEAMETLSAAGAEDPAAILRPLLRAALDNALVAGDLALTGPIVRGDAGTVAAHLHDLSLNAPHVVPSYIALARATMRRAQADGRLTGLRALKISQILDEYDVAPGSTASIETGPTELPR